MLQTFDLMAILFPFATLSMSGKSKSSLLTPRKHIKKALNVMVPLLRIQFYVFSGCSQLFPASKSNFNLNKRNLCSADRKGSEKI